METVNFKDATPEQQIQYLWGDTKPYCTVTAMQTVS